jgi:hypothetical protein
MALYFARAREQVDVELEKMIGGEQARDDRGGARTEAAAQGNT